MITYNDFEKYLTKIQRIHELEDKILNLGDEYSDLVLKWAEWANKAKPEEYDPFYKESASNE